MCVGVCVVVCVCYRVCTVVCCSVCLMHLMCALKGYYPRRFELIALISPRLTCAARGNAGWRDGEDNDQTLRAPRARQRSPRRRSDASVGAARRLSTDRPADEGIRRRPSSRSGSRLGSLRSSLCRQNAALLLEPWGAGTLQGY